MRSNKQSETDTIHHPKMVARKTKRHPIDRAANRQSCSAILTDLKNRLSEIYDLNAAGSVLSWDEATYMPNGGEQARRPKMPGKQTLSPRQLERQRDRERIMFGTQGAASSVRRVDLASVDTAALVAQLDQRTHAPRRRLPFRLRIFAGAQRSSVF